MLSNIGQLFCPMTHEDLDSRPPLSGSTWQADTSRIPPFVWFSSVQSLSRVRLFATRWTAAHQASLSITDSRNLLKLMSIKSVMPSNQLILSSPSLPAFNLSQHQGLSNESVLHISWPKYWSFTFSICPSNEYSGLDYMDRIVNLVDASQNKTHQNFSFKQKNMFYFYC